MILTDASRCLEILELKRRQVFLETMIVKFKALLFIIFPQSYFIFWSSWQYLLIFPEHTF